MDFESRDEEYRELMANVRRLTIMVLDDLEEGLRERTLDQAQRRLLSSTGTRLLRLWRAVLREGGSERTTEELKRISGELSKTSESSRDRDTELSENTTANG